MNNVLALLYELSCETKVDDLDDVVIDHEVVDIDISVNKVQDMHFLERCNHLKTQLNYELLSSCWKLLLEIAFKGHFQVLKLKMALW